MSRHLALSFRFLSPWFHGRGDAGVPEWPPSPLRAYQALVAAAARAGTLDAIRSALTWLEDRPAPCIIASDAVLSTAGYRLSVPHNAMELVGRQWCRGEEGNAAEHRTMKNVRAHRLPEESVVHYVWPVDADLSNALPLIHAARSVVALGWGIDLVVGDGAVVEDAQLAEWASTLIGWEARNDGRWELRTPTRGSLDDLERRHTAFLSRTSFTDATVRPAPALSTFNIVRYARSDQPRVTDIAGFTLMRVDADNFRAFDCPSRGKAVAGMLRHAMRIATERAGWDQAKVNACVLGHGKGHEARFLLVPVPSVEPRGMSGETVGAIRRVMVYSTAVEHNDTAWVARALGGMDLVDAETGEVQAVLAVAPVNDRVLGRYLAEADTWATVTPLVLPGHDDSGGLREKLRKATRGEARCAYLERLMTRRERLIRKALRHAGLSDELVHSARIETSDTGFIAGVRKASRYAVPSHLIDSPRLHVKLTWPRKFKGPLCIGRGRYSGLGLFVAVA